MGTKQLGAIGEQMAVRHLERAGMVVLERNWRCAVGGLRGEIDIIARDGPVVVVCEVKARRGVAAGHPLEAVTPLKLARLRRLAAAWLRAAGCSPAQVRIDVVGVCWPAAGGRAVVTHVRGAG